MKHGEQCAASRSVELSTVLVAWTVRPSSVGRERRRRHRWRGVVVMVVVQAAGGEFGC